MHSGSPTAVSFHRIQLWLAAHPRWLLTLLVAALLGPMLAKPFNIDDPLFIWLAQQVRAHPENPFGFSVNWYGQWLPMWAVTENPPLAGYYYALASSLLGWSEVGLHLAAGLTALAVVLGTYRLAAHFCSQPLLAACAVLVTPIFLVSANTVMSDMLMLAFWVWAVVFWVEGLAQNHAFKLCLSGGFIALALLTKYFGVALLPLLAAHGALQQRRFGGWVAALLLPLLVLGAYEWLTAALYGHALFSGAAHFVSQAHGKLGFSKLASGSIALCFLGGGTAVVLALAPWLWRARTVVLTVGAAAVVGGWIYASQVLPKFGALEGPARGLVAAQFVFWLAGGILVLSLSSEVRQTPRDHGAWLLALWLAGTFLFAGIGNWTVNGRSLLPLLPAVGILMARRWERGRTKPPWALTTGLAAAAVLAVAVAESDFQTACAARQSAGQVMAHHGQSNGVVWFEGHWGFQYYMEKLGAKSIDFHNFNPQPEDILVLPLFNTYTSEPPPDLVTQRAVVSVPGPVGITSWHPALGAGFYSSVTGPLPFGFGPVPAENIYVYHLKPKSTP